MSAFACHDCGADDHEGYMVHNEVWLAAWPTYKEDRRKLGRPSKGAWDNGPYLLLCWTCLERRLGRPLAVEDFTPAPINEAVVERLEAFRAPSGTC